MSAAEISPLVGLPSRDVFLEAADCSNAELERRLLTLAGQIASAEAEFLIYLGLFRTLEYVLEHRFGGYGGEYFAGKS